MPGTLVELSGAPGVARLAVLPGLTRYQVGSDPALAAAVLPFLRAPMSDAH